MRQILIFPSGFQVDISDSQINQDVNTVYDAGWIGHQDICMHEWIINAKVNEKINNEDVITIYLEHASVSKSYKLP